MAGDESGNADLRLGKLRHTQVTPAKPGKPKEKIGSASASAFDTLESFSDVYHDSTQEKVDPEGAWVDEEAEPQRLVGLKVLSGMLVVALVGTITYLYLPKRTGQDSGSGQLDVLVSAAQIDLPIIQTPIEAMSAEELRAAVTKTLTGFMDAKSIDSCHPHLLEGSEHLEKMTAFYQRPGETFPAGFKKLISHQYIPSNGSLMIVASAQDQEDKTHHFSMIPMEDRLVIDWLSSVGYSEISWEQFYEEKPVHPQTMRIFLGLSQRIESRLFREESGSIEYVRYTNPHDQVRRTAYVSPGTDTNHQVARYLHHSPTNALSPATVTMIWNKEKGCPEITNFLHPLWIDSARLP